MSARSEEIREQRAGQVARTLDKHGPDYAGPAEEPMAVDIAPDRRRDFTGRTANLSRMTLSWSPADQIVMMEVRRNAEKVLRSQFAAAYEIMQSVWSRVRTPEVSDGGDILRDEWGDIRWVRSVTGRPLEDWSRFGHGDREEFLYRTISVLHELEQAAADMWGEAMFAKAAWEERFSAEFTRPEGRKTVEDRENIARQGSMEERYFGIFQSWLSRRAEALVRNITLLNQRLKDLEG